MGYYQIENISTYNYLFKLKSKNGQMILKSINFDTLEELEKTLQKLRSLSIFDKYYALHETSEGYFNFSIVDERGKTLAHGNTYETKSGRTNGIRSCMKNAPTSNILPSKIYSDIIHT